MKNILLAISLLLLCPSVKAQSLQVKDLSNSVGNWEGKLTYMDYSTGKPYTMSANIKISLTADNKGYIMGYEYPKEPHANSIDTTYIVDNYFGKDKIVSFKKDASGGYTLVTEVDGNDGNDNKKAVLRHSYLFKTNSFSIIKEVKFEGTDNWIKRNEYVCTFVPLQAFAQNTQYTVTSFLPEGPLAPNTHYIGEAWLSSVLQGDSELNYNITKATFRKNSTLDWHKHSTPQVLIVIDGEGYYQEKGKEPIIIKKGDVVRCSKDVEHWHTASKENLITYLALYDGSKPTIWTDKLTQEYYDNVAQKLKGDKK